MCGRFVSSSTPDELAAYFGVDEVAESVLAPNFNVAPTQDVHAVVEHDERRFLDAFFWGLVPSWAKDLKTGARMINARAETLDEKPAFKKPFATRRCIVPADGFYEWQRIGGSGRSAKKQPMYITAATGEPLAFAALWAVWRGPDHEQEPLRSVTVITTSPNATMAPIHDRMPAILPASAWDQWLDRTNHDTTALARLLVPAPEGLLQVTPVSTAVNDVRHNGPELIVRCEPETLFLA